MEEIWRYKKQEPFFGSWYFEKNQKEIGSGNFGKVYRIIRHDTNVRPSALKIITIPGKSAELETLRFQGLNEQDIRQYYQEMAEDIKKEYELMSELKGCDNIVSCEDFKIIQSEDTICFDIMIRMELLMPLINYQTETNREIGEGEIVKLGIDICKALERCQINNIIHRDIKPENIFISQFGNFKLGDFGIARTMEKTDMLMSRKGTKSYMAPEVYNTKPYDKTVDIYSLGIVLYQMLNDNCIPFLTPSTAKNADARDIAFIERINGRELKRPAHGSDELVNIILKACRYEKSERYQNPLDMRLALEKLPISEIDMSGIDIFEFRKDSDIDDITELLSEDKEDPEKTQLLKKGNTLEIKEIQKGKKNRIILGTAAALAVVGIGGGSLFIKNNLTKQVTENENIQKEDSMQKDNDLTENRMIVDNQKDIVTSPAALDENNNITSKEEQILEERKLATKLKGKDLEKFSDLSDYENLKSLDLSEMEIDDISILSNLKKLEELNICYTNIEDISALKKCKKLISLNLSYNNENMTEKKVMTVLSNMTQLQELDLTGNLVAGDYENELASLTSLEVLRVGATGILDGNFLRKLKKLRVLDINSNLMFENFKEITKLEELEELNISVTGITKLNGIEKLKKLKVLNLGMTEISDISMLKSLKKLESVTVSNNLEIKKQIKQLKKILKDCKFELI